MGMFLDIWMFAKTSSGLLKGGQRLFPLYILNLGIARPMLVYNALPTTTIKSIGHALIHQNTSPSVLVRGSLLDLGEGSKAL
jgi:hypothetical protein